MDPDKKMDLFDKLPNPVVSHILSFIPTKEAASSSVLAKRWRNLFAFVPNLHLDDSVFLHPGEGKRERDGVLESFMDFVDRVLALQGNAPIKKFSLKVKTGVDTSRVDRWIRNVVERGVSHLELLMEFDEDYSLPYEVSVSKTLVELKAGYGVDLYSWDDEISLPMLKTLELDSVGFGRGQFQTLLPACPVLEVFKLVNMEWRDRNEIVSSSSLKKLTISSEGGCLGTFSFDTPNLVSLDYSDCVAEDYPIVNLENLVEVLMNLILTKEGLARGYNAYYLICGIQNVKTFHLTPATFMVLSYSCTAMPRFNNLTILNIRSDMLLGWEALPLLLRNSPNLETLYIECLLHTVTEQCGYVCGCVSRKNTRSFLSYSPVKQIQIKGFRGTIREMDIVRYFLDNFPNLKKMLILPEQNEETLFQIPKWLEVVTDTLMHYDQTSSCNIGFMGYGSLYNR